jgi:hypothetical protein
VPERSRTSSLVAGLTGLGGVLLLGSLFLTWSHQLTRPELTRFGGAALYGVARAPTAFQVYASADIVLVLVAIGITAAGLPATRNGWWGQRPARALALLAALLGLAFVIRAAVSAPTNGVLLAQGRGAHARYFPDPATPGVGETVAIIGLACGAVGLLVGMALPRRGST